MSAIETVAILGAGSVGQALAQRLVASGLDVRFGVRDPAQTKLQIPSGLRDVPVLPATDAATGAQAVMLAVPADAAVAAVGAAGLASGRIVVDCTNPLRWDKGPVWAPPPAGSVAQALAAVYPDLPIVKGFNHFGAEIQANPDLVGGPADAFFAADDPAARQAVMRLAERMGFRAYDAGALRNAGVLENLAVLWIQLAVAGGAGRQFSFRVVARE